MPERISSVMLIDDDANIRLIARMSIEGLTSWSVRLAPSGAEALAMLQQEKPDLVLLDIMMPGMDGTTVFSKMQEDKELSSIPVIFMTAKVQTHEVEAYLKLGAAGVITKPFDPMTLPKDIGKILGCDVVLKR